MGKEEFGPVLMGELVCAFTVMGEQLHGETIMEERVCGKTIFFLFELPNVRPAAPESFSLELVGLPSFLCPYCSPCLIIGALFRAHLQSGTLGQYIVGLRARCCD